jgi:hypothetical protein
MIFAAEALLGSRYFYYKRYFDGLRYLDERCIVFDSNA